MKIKLVKSADIDKVKWNSCVHYAPAGNIFGYKWYLDAVVKEWDGLVEGEYESVFPLIWKDRKFRSQELYEHELIRSNGLYTVHINSTKRIQAFLDHIPDDYKKVNFSLSEGLNVPKESGFEETKRSNYLLLLNKPYEDLSNDYTDELKQKLDGVVNGSLIVSGNIKPEKLAAFYQKHADKKIPDSDFHALQRIMYNCLHRGWGGASGILDAEGELIAADFFIFSHKRIMSLMPAVSPKGKALHALDYLYDMQIRRSERKPLLLDFNTKSTSNFARSFNAAETPFYSLKKEKKFLNII